MLKSHHSAVPPGALARAQHAIAMTANGFGFLLALMASTFLVAMSVILFLQVIYRYVLALPLPWSEEAARFCLVWFAILASCVAGQQGMHFAVRWCVNWLPARLREATRIAVLVYGTVVLVFLTMKSAEYLSVVGDLIATATEISLYWVYLALPFGFGSLALIQLFELFDSIVGLRTRKHFGRWRLVEDFAFKQLLERDE